MTQSKCMKMVRTHAIAIKVLLTFDSHEDLYVGRSF